MLHELTHCWVRGTAARQGRAELPPFKQLANRFTQQLCHWDEFRLPSLSVLVTIQLGNKPDQLTHPAENYSTIRLTFYYVSKLI